MFCPVNTLTQYSDVLSCQYINAVFSKAIREKITSFSKFILGYFANFCVGAAFKMRNTFKMRNRCVQNAILFSHKVRLKCDFIFS